MNPIYWKPKYATRGQRHRAWVKREARREEALKRAPKGSLWRFLFRRRGNI